MSALEAIVDRAIEYTKQILYTMPSYRRTAIEGLGALRDTLAQQAPDDPAIGKLDAFLDGLRGDGALN